MTRRPSAKATFNGHVVFRLLWTGIPSMTKIWVAPESAIAAFDAIVIAANEGNAVCWIGGGCVLVRIAAYMYASGCSDSILVVDPVETFEVTTVMSSSSSTITSWAGENI
jgi:actin-like ATPase involved in cell morphogenesis